MFANTVVPLLGASLILLANGVAGTSLGPGPTRPIVSLLLRILHDIPYPDRDLWADALLGSRVHSASRRRL
jgi:hypothetical protein